MKTRMSLGDLISELYDTVHTFGGSRSTSQVVTACTLDLLLRQRKRSIITALFNAGFFNPAESALH